MICPCKNCEKKGCGSYHDQCNEYQVWSDWRKQFNQNRLMDQEMLQISRDHERKYRRKKGGRR